MNFNIYLNVYITETGKRHSYIISDKQQIKIQNKIKNYYPPKIAHKAPIAL